MSPSDRVVARLEVFTALIQEWTPRINLISATDRQHLWNRHIADSLQLADYFPQHLSRAIDLGSGGGFPGLVLAIATNVQFELIEADRRKAAFLREAIRATNATAIVNTCRIENLRITPAAVVTARALAPLPKLLTLTHPFLQPDGHALFLKGAGVAAELTEAAKQWQMDVRQLQSRTNARAVILDISGLKRVGLAR